MLAWLTTPKVIVNKKTGIESVHPSRLETNYGNVMPDFLLKDLEFTYLLEHFYELGWCKQSGDATVPMDWVDIKAWSDVTETNIDAWESVTLVEMSSAYVSWHYKAKDMDCPPP